MPRKPKAPKKCKHTGDIFPLRDEESMRRDPIDGWVVDVYCGQCFETGATQVNTKPKEVSWDGPLPADDGNYELVRRYGPFTEIGRAREKKLCELGMENHILTIKGCDSDESEDGYTMFAHVGHGLVNVETIFESANPMPMSLEISDFWYDDHLKAP